MLLVLTLNSCASTPYYFLAYGDLGQIDSFTAVKGNYSNDANLFVLDDINQTCKAAPNAVFSGLAQFKKVLDTDLSGPFKFLCQADQIITLGDHLYIEGVSMIKENTPQYDAYKKRLMCGSYCLKENFNSIQCPSSGNKPFTKSADKKFNKIKPLTGNHSYDVDYKVDFKFRTDNYEFKGQTINTEKLDLTQYSPKVLTDQDIIIKPFIEVVEKDGSRRLEILYVNPTLMYCYLFNNPTFSIEVWNKCYSVANQYGIFHTFEQAKAYVEALIAGIKSFTKAAHWRIICQHQPTFNINGYPDEQDFWFRIPLGTDKKTLMDHMKENNVNIVLNSHHHSFQIQAFPWNQFDLMKSTLSALPADKTIGLAAQFDLENNACGTGKCKTQTPPTCYYNDKLLGGKTLSTTCDIMSTMTMKYNPQAPKNLLSFIIGHSGRIFDPLLADQMTPGTTLFARKNKHGGLMFEFNEKTFTAKMFEEDKLILTFSTTEELVNDVYPVLSSYVQSKLNGTHVNVEKNIINDFDYARDNVTISASSWINLTACVFSIILFIL